ncbi:MAG TPA: hypothetical protein VHI52_18035 [Verrucomicrobiae bacterium]|nr:hypothetical protein [Verrucomicrobiae bacterium]
MSAQLLAERVSDMIPGYEELFAGRGGVTPTDPLKFHLYHLARYWSRLVGFCRQTPMKPEGWIDGDLGACVLVGSEFAHKLIGPDSPIYGRWQDYWAQTQAMLHQRPVSLEAVEAASRTFGACVADLKYDPWC